MGSDIPGLYLMKVGERKEKVLRETGLTDDDIRGLAIEGTPMEERRIKLNEGDCLLFYTDGLSEAFSPDGNLFGEKRIITALQAGSGKSAERVLQGIEADLDKFVAEEAQSEPESGGEA